jgi:hypothetical protein
MAPTTLAAEPGPGTGAARDLGGGFKEREPGTLGINAVPAVFGPEDLDGDGDVPDPSEAAFLPSRRHHTAGRTARWLVGFDNDLAAPIGQQMTDMTP